MIVEETPKQDAAKDLAHEKESRARRGLLAVAGVSSCLLVVLVVYAMTLPHSADAPHLSSLPKTAVPAPKTRPFAAPVPQAVPLTNKSLPPTHSEVSAPGSVLLQPKPAVNYAQLKPNEIGRVPILMYHSTGDHTTYRGRQFDSEGLNIRPETFRKQLETMYKAGWYPVNLCDLMKSRLNVPAGKTPVVLTFDDARVSQFRYLGDGRIDPDSFVGMMVAFHETHTDWPLAGTFFVLPYSSYNPTPFGQAKFELKKLKWLTDNGFELANHSTTHRPFSRLDASQLKYEIGHCAQYFQNRDPNAQMCTVALPYGIRPRGAALLQVLMNDGSGKSPYNNRCIVLAAGNASYAPMDKRLNALLVTRIGSQPGNIETWINRLRKDNVKSSWKPYISDGDPDTLAVPKPLAKYVVTKRLWGVRMVAYDLPTNPKPAKTLVAKTAKN